MVYIIGEIGQNHNGSVDLAKLLIEMITRPIKEELFNLSLHGLNAVKLTKRDLKEELSKSQMLRPYIGPNSFGATYGDHRRHLELDDEQHYECYKHAKKNGLEFIETLCGRGCLSLLNLFTPDRLKVASRDLTNIPLLEALAETKIPMILSTGMAGKKELDNALDVVTRFHSNISILHCVSEYPTKPQNVNLNSIAYLKRKYNNYKIGYSDHTIGIATPVAAVAMGAQIIEKHITLDRRMKGTDQAGSLGLDGLNRMIRDIRVIEMSLGIEDIFIDESTRDARLKLERSIATKRRINAGEVITDNDIHLLSPGDGFKWVEKSEVLGKKTLVDVEENEVIYKFMIG
jgi:sialic acid synthase